MVNNMTQQIIHQNGVILQWQDTEQFNYAAPGEGIETLEVTAAQWAKQDTLKWVKNGKPTSVAPVVKPVEVPPIVPPSVSRFQALMALHNAGLLEQVEAAMANPDTPMLYRLAFKEAKDFERGSETVTAMGAQLELTDAQLDDLFIAASQIQA